MKNFIERIFPKRILSSIYYILGKNRIPEVLFTKIYKNNKWGKDPDGNKYFSGPGSLDPNTEKYKTVLKDFINDFDIKSVFEIGCGDFRIMKSVLSETDINYTGVDVVKDLIEHHSNEYGNEKVNFMHMDAVSSENFPPADLCIIRQVLQHLSNKQIAEIIRKTKKYKYLIITEHVPLYPNHKNVDKGMSGNIRLQKKELSGVFLDAPPFSLTSKVLLSYRNDYNSVPAIILTSLVENNMN
jgi:SAM-dependent methyltransferase